TYEHIVHLAIGHHVIRTQNLSGGADTMLHVSKFRGVEVVHDDDSGGALSSLVSFDVTEEGDYNIFVHAYSKYTTGTCDVLVDGATYASGVPVAGTKVTVPSIPSGNYEYETAVPPNGAPDTMLYGLDANYKLVAFDDDQGVRMASKLTGSSIRY